MQELAKAYDPAEVEPRWYAFWEAQGVFRASEDPDDPRPVYAITMPPPNVTGSLHMGHALGGTIQDVLVRHKRMQGYNVLWQPGVDHAGIATQIVVERQLQREGKSRHDLGREAFLERVWRWKEKSGGRILQQKRVLGCSADWERTQFTMDPGVSRAVREAFVRLYEEGLIYRATRLINWCSDCRTALSDLEVESEPETGELYEFAYPVRDPDPKAGATELIVATTRPETMLGDTAVAVHPDDPRYRHLHNRTLVHPFVNREIPIILDAVLVDMSFGTGAVKVTPAHDFNDFATGKRHGLKEINILNQDGSLNGEAGEFQGLTVKAARTAVKRALRERGLERGTKSHSVPLPRCTRSGTVVEPLISTQWFVQMSELAEPALRAVREGRTQIYPEEWVKTYEHWLTQIQDWCISRQLWWGHPIPAFHCGTCGKLSVTREVDLVHCAHCKSTELARDPDVLDTWFSSGLWPFSTLGWPENTVALRRFYPTSDMETGYDILFFWVARMLMLGLKFMGEVPFRRVLLHGMVVDETGEKMGKLRGNTIDPLDLIHGAPFESVVQKALPDAPVEQALAKFRKAYPSTSQMGKAFSPYGADALRFTLASYSPQARRIALSPGRIDGYRRFCNKIYNAVRFALPYVSEVVLDDGAPPRATLLLNAWIISRLGTVVEQSTTGIQGFRLDEGSGALYHFFWDELCDWYIEMAKGVLASGTPLQKSETQKVLAHTLETALRALHPYMPFVTEELWQRLPRPASRPISIALAPYPTAADGWLDADAEAWMERLQGVVSAARSIRSEHEVHPGARVPLELRGRDPKTREFLEQQSGTIELLVGSDGKPHIAPTGGARPPGSVVAIGADVEVLVGLRGLVEAVRERERVERLLKKLDKDKEVLTKRLANPSFATNAPPEVVTEARELLEQLQRKRTQLEESLALSAEL